MPWYVVALILAIIVLLVSLGAIWKIRQSQEQANDQLLDTCKTISGGTCVKATACGTNENKMPGICPKEHICCKPIE